MAVYIEKQSTYDLQAIADIVRRGISDIGLDLSDKKSAVIKVNIVQARQPDTGIITHPTVTEAVIDVLEEAGIKQITIIEGPALGVDVRDAFKTSGYHALAKRRRVELVNAFEAPRKKLEVGYGYEGLPNVYEDEDLQKYYSGCMTVPAICVDADLYVSIPKLKTHNRAKVTLCLKNQWGLLDFKERQDYHRTGLHEPIAYLAKGVRPQLTIVDGIVGLEGNGPILGAPKKADLIVVGTDAIETDIVGSQLMGHDPRQVEHISRAVEFGLGRWDVDVRGLSIAEAAVDFVPAPLTLKKSLNFHLWRNHRACHLDDDSFAEAFRIAKRKPKYWMFFVKLGYYVLFKRIDVLRGRGMMMPDVPGNSKIILSGECIRDLLNGYEEIPPNVIHIPGCPPDPEDIIKAIIRM